MDITQAKEEVIRAGKELLASGLIARTWGNISARISDEQFVVTPSGKAYDGLTPEDIVVVNIADGSYEGDVKPSSEKGVHAAAYRLRRDVDFVIHTHQDFATDLSVLGRQFHLNMTDKRIREKLGPFIPTARYALSSTKALEKHVAHCIRKYPQCRTVLMRNHGTLCMGKSREDAFDVANTLEEICKMKIAQTIGTDLPVSICQDPEARSRFARTYRREIHEEYDAHHLIFDNPKVGCVIETRAPFIVAASSFGKSMRAYVDDLAQIAGPVIKCLPADATEEKIAKALSGESGAVLIREKGAICTGRDADDAEAVTMVLDKGCQAALLARAVRHRAQGRTTRPVGRAGGILEHIIYTKKYSKLKDTPQEGGEADE